MKHHLLAEATQTFAKKSKTESSFLPVVVQTLKLCLDPCGMSMMDLMWLIDEYIGVRYLFVGGLDSDKLSLWDEIAGTQPLAFSLPANRWHPELSINSQGHILVTGGRNDVHHLTGKKQDEFLPTLTIDLSQQTIQEVPKDKEHVLI